MKSIGILCFIFVLVGWNTATFAAKKKPPHAFQIELDPTPVPSATPKKVPTGPLILDARGRFDFVMEHIQDSLPVRWEDYSQEQMPHKGLLDPDAGLLARKLRVLGVSREREVIVLGKGEKGGGEEGRIAWMLKYLGVKNIRFMSFSTFKNLFKKVKRTSGDHEPVESAALWLPQVDESLRIRKTELEKIVSEKPSDIVIVDVRAPEEYQGKKASGEKRLGHIPGSINIPWTRFVNDASDPMGPDNVRRILKEAGLGSLEGKTFVFYCAGGVRSAYVTMAARETGLKVRNFDGSLWEWSDDPRLPMVK